MNQLKHQVYLGLGSNLAHPFHQLNCGLAHLAKHPAIELITYSSFYVTSPVGPQDQPSFINAVAVITTTLDPFDLLAVTQAIEKKQGRPDFHPHWGPRTLDIDILLYGNQTLTTPTLTIPHPEMFHRQFVLEPLNEIKFRNDNV